MDLYELPIHQHQFHAMGSTFSIWLLLHNASSAEDLLHQAQALVDQAEARMTRFNATSELARLNRAAGTWAVLSRPMWQVVGRALHMARETGGLFDPTVLTAMLAAGYDRSFEQIGSGAMNCGTTMQRATGQWQAITCDAARHAILLPAGVGLDLGGIAKGFTAEQVVNFLSQWGPCLVDAGGDLTAGDAPGDYPGWPVAIAMPSTPAEPEPPTAVPLWLSNATLATSGVDYRWWQHGERRLHHLIDPRTGLPAANKVVTASVLCADACRAEAWATAALVAGEQLGPARLDEQRLAGVLIEAGGRIHQTSTMSRYVIDGALTAR